MDVEIKPIAYIYTDFPTKFGVPRQSGLADKLKAEIQIEKEYCDENAFRGLEEFSHIWLIWCFSEVENEVGYSWHPTVRPPRLGGNVRKGVFATRSPYRPNPIGLSVVRLEKISFERGSIILHVTGADMMNRTPIYDIKPYLPYVDNIPTATGGFTEKTKGYELQVHISSEYQELLPTDKYEALVQILQQDPRPSYHEDKERIYGFSYDKWEVKFCVEQENLTVIEIINK